MNSETLSSTSILFVDDEKLIRNSFSRDLRAEGFKVTTATNGTEAVEALQHNEYDLVITDLRMPELDGFGVLKTVKQCSPQTSVLILTGYGDMRSAIDALRLGADDFALKPCEFDDLMFRIRRCFEKRSLLQTMALQNRQLEEEIRQRRVAEEKLRASENRFRMALDAASNGVWDRNLLTGEVFYGANWLRTLGYEKNELKSTHFQLEDLLHPDDRERVLALFEDHIIGKTETYAVEYRIQKKNGEYRWVLSRGQVVERNDDGKALRMMGTLTDINLMKAFEAELGKKLQERTADLSEANAALNVLLKKRDEDKNMLADQVHDNTTKLIEPLLGRLRETDLTEQQKTLVDLLRTNILELTAPFATQFSSKLLRLSPIELQVANMVKQGKRSKEIAAIMQLSPGTVNIHRKNIRRKLEIAHQKTNLQATLSLQY
jgi:PAS domain S-box-containing protein